MKIKKIRIEQTEEKTTKENKPEWFVHVADAV